MEELMKKFAHLDEATRRRIKNFVSSKGLISEKNKRDYNRIMQNLEHQIHKILREGAHQIG